MGQGVGAFSLFSSGSPGSLPCRAVLGAPWGTWAPRCPVPGPTFSPLIKRCFSLRFTWSMDRPCSALDSKTTDPSGLDTTRPFLPVIWLRREKGDPHQLSVW